MFTKLTFTVLWSSTHQLGNDSNNQTSDLQTKPLTPSEMEAIEARMMQRNWHLTERCAFYGLDQTGKYILVTKPFPNRSLIFETSPKQTGNDTLHKPNPWEFLISKKHHLVWCNVFKAASTSWMYNFNLLAGYSPQFLKKSQIVPLTLARKKYPRPSVAQVSVNPSVT